MFYFGPVLEVQIGLVNVIQGTNRIGTGIKSLVQAPEGCVLVGADVDSQEQWLAGLFGDASHAATFGMSFLGYENRLNSKPLDARFVRLKIGYYPTHSLSRRSPHAAVDPRTSFPLPSVKVLLLWHRLHFSLLMFHHHLNPPLF